MFTTGDHSMRLYSMARSSTAHRRHRRHPRIERLEGRLQPGSVLSPALLGDVMLSLLPVDATTEVAAPTQEKRKSPRRSLGEDFAAIPPEPFSALIDSFGGTPARGASVGTATATASPGY